MKEYLTFAEQEKQLLEEMKQQRNHYHNHTTTMNGTTTLPPSSSPSPLSISPVPISSSLSWQPININPHDDLSMDDKKQSATPATASYLSSSSSSRHASNNGNGNDNWLWVRASSLYAALQRINIDLHHILPSSLLPILVAYCEPSEQEKKTIKSLETSLTAHHIDLGNESVNNNSVNDAMSNSPSWDHVLSASAKQELTESIIFPLAFPHLFRSPRRACQETLLVGAPGMGKTYIMRALCRELHRRNLLESCIYLSATSLCHAYGNDSEQIIKDVWSLAKLKQPAIIVIDEIDAISTMRDGDVNGDRSRRYITSIMVQMESAQRNITNNIYVIGITNEPWLIDARLRRRFSRRISLHALPDDAQRLQYIQLLFSDVIGNNELSHDDISHLVTATSAFTFADIYSLCRDVMMQPVRRISAMMPRKWYEVKRNGSMACIPCNHINHTHTHIHPHTPATIADDNDASKCSCVEYDMESLPSSAYIPLIPSDIIACVAKDAKPSVSADILARYVEWWNQFGTDT